MDYGVVGYLVLLLWGLFPGKDARRLWHGWRRVVMYCKLLCSLDCITRTMTRNRYSALTTGASEQHGLVRLCIVFLVLQMIIRTDPGNRSLCFPFFPIFLAFSFSPFLFYYRARAIWGRSVFSFIPFLFEKD